MQVNLAMLTVLHCNLRSNSTSSSVQELTAFLSAFFRVSMLRFRRLKLILLSGKVQAEQTEQIFSHCCPHALMSQRIHIEFAHPRASDGIRILSSVHGSSAIKCTVERAIGQAQKTFCCRGATNTRVNPDTIGCVWMGEFGMNTL